MKKLILVRHGETDWNSIRRIQGARSDTPLNASGRAQAESLSLRLKDEKIQAVYSSPLQRALHTAQAIARPHHLEVGILPDIREIEVGELEGKSSLEMDKRFDELLICHDGSEPLPTLRGGESLLDVQQRAWSTIRELIDDLPEGALVVVSHYFVIMAVVCAVIHLPMTEITHLRSTPGAISIITFDASRVRLELFNDICHIVNQ